MSRAAALAAVLYEAESVWGEAVATYANRFNAIESVDVSGLVHDRVDSQHVVQHAGDYGTPVITTMGGSFTVKTHLSGHGSTTAGALSVEEHEQILAYAIGNVLTTGTGTTFTGGSPTAPTTTAASGFAAGGGGFAGVLGDAGGLGQPFIVSTHAANTLNLLTELPNNPLNGAGCFSAMNVFPTETPSSQSITSTRWRILTANGQYELHGCFPTQVVFDGLSPGGVPTYAVTFSVSWWTFVAGTFPTTTPVDRFLPAAVAAGSLFVQQRGTATRQTYSCRDFRMTVDLGIQAEKGPGGLNQYQDIIGAVRGQHSCTIEFTVDAGNASETPTWPTRWDSNGDWHILYGLNGAASGQRMGIYAPNACFIGAKPVQRNDGGINRERVMFRTKTGPTTTSELTLSSFRLFFG